MNLSDWCLYPLKRSWDYLIFMSIIWTSLKARRTTFIICLLSSFDWINTSNWLGTLLSNYIISSQKKSTISSFDLMFDRLGNERECRFSWYRARMYVVVLRLSRARCDPTLIFSHYQCLYSGYRFGRWMVACSWCGCGVGTGALAILGGSSLVELLGDG